MLNAARAATGPMRASCGSIPVRRVVGLPDAADVRRAVRRARRSIRRLYRRQCEITAAIDTTSARARPRDEVESLLALRLGFSFDPCRRAERRCDEPMNIVRPSGTCRGRWRACAVLRLVSRDDDDGADLDRSRDAVALQRVRRAALDHHSSVLPLGNAFSMWIHACGLIHSILTIGPSG